MLFNFVKYSCSCSRYIPLEMKRNNKTASNKGQRTCSYEVPQGQFHSYGSSLSPNKDFIEKGECSKMENLLDSKPSDKRVNEDRNREVVNVQAYPVLLDFWSGSMNIVDVECGDRHTLFHLGMFISFCWTCLFFVSFRVVRLKGTVLVEGIVEHINV